MCEVVGVGRMVLHVTKCSEHDCQKFNVRHVLTSLHVSVLLSVIYRPARLPLVPCSACASCRVTCCSLAGLLFRLQCRAIQCSDSLGT